MAIPLTCPGCQAAFEVPESLSGKTIRCTSCKTQLTVSPPAPASKKPFGAASSPAVAAAPAAPAAKAAVRPAAKVQVAVADDDDDDARTNPKKPAAKPAAKPTSALKRRRDDDDDDDHDDEDDRPRRKKKNASGGSGAMIALIAGGVVCLAAVAGLSIWLLSGDEKKDTAKSDSSSSSSSSTPPSPSQAQGDGDTPPGRDDSGKESSKPPGRPMRPSASGGTTAMGDSDTSTPPQSIGSNPSSRPPGSDGTPPGRPDISGPGGGIPSRPPVSVGSDFGRPPGSDGTPPGRPDIAGPGGGIPSRPPVSVGSDFGRPPGAPDVPGDQPPGIGQPPGVGLGGQPPGGIPGRPPGIGGGQPGRPPIGGGQPGRPPVGGIGGPPPGGIGGGIGQPQGGGGMGAGPPADTNPAPTGAITNGKRKARIDQFFTGVFDSDKNEFLTFTSKSEKGKVATKLNRYDVAKNFIEAGSYKVPKFVTRAVIDQSKGLLYAATATANASVGGDHQYEQTAGVGDIEVFDLNAIRSGKVESGADLKPLGTFIVGPGKKVHGMELSPDGKSLIVLTTTTVANAKSSPKSFLTRYDTETKKPLATEKPKELSAPAWDMRKSPDGKHLVIVDLALGQNATANVRTYDIGTLVADRSLPLQGTANDASLTTTGQFAAVVMGATGTKVLLATETETKDFDLGFGWKAAAHPGYVEYSPDGKLMYVSGHVALAKRHSAGLDVYEVTDPNAPNGVKKKASILTAGGDAVGGHFFISPDGESLVFHTGVVLASNDIGGSNGEGTASAGAPGGVPGGAPGTAPGIAPGGASGDPPGVAPGAIPGGVPPGGVPPGGPPAGLPGTATPAGGPSNPGTAPVRPQASPSSLPPGSNAPPGGAAPGAPPVGLPGNN